MRYGGGHKRLQPVHALWRYDGDDTWTELIRVKTLDTFEWVEALRAAADAALRDQPRTAFNPSLVVAKILEFIRHEFEELEPDEQHLAVALLWEEVAAWMCESVPARKMPACEHAVAEFILPPRTSAERLEWRKLAVRLNQARQEKLTPEQRSELAKRAAKARWDSKHFGG